MDVILFFLLAFLTVFFSIKLSFYADMMSKTTKINKALIGGILLAGITSLPELVTCFSSLAIDNPYLAIGDILGSNLFNIFIICFFDIFFIKRMIFDNVPRKKSLVYLFLIINYLAIYIFFKGIDISILHIGFPTLIIIITYLIYIFSLPKDNNIETRSEKKVKYLILKFVLTIIAMLIVSISLTLTVNNISSNHPEFSSSLLGAILLGITTSLPEVITFYALIKLNSYDIALSNLIGSNLFNLLVISLGDIFFLKNSVYYYSDKETFSIIKIVILVTIINLFQIIKTKSSNKVFYIIPSILIVIIYFLFWIVNFTH